MILDLVEVALGSGTSLPRALEAVGQVLNDTFGQDLISVGGALRLGADWNDAWELAGEPGRPLCEILEPAWTAGASATAIISRACAMARRSKTTRAAENAQRLGVLLVLPLGLCFLPAFILIAVVPVFLSYAKVLF